MNLPSKVKIGYIDYVIRPMTAVEIDEVGHGSHNPRTCVIKIDTSMCWARQVETLWHEVKHALHEALDLTDESKEEDFCLRGSPAELAFFKDNPGFLEILAQL